MLTATTIQHPAASPYIHDMQSRFESPSLNSTLSADQRLMERAREAAIRVRKEEQENLVLGRKRKLKDLCQVARQIQWNKALSGQYVFKSGRTEIDDFEQRFLEFNDLFLGRLYDESTLHKLFATTFSSSSATKQTSLPPKSVVLPQCVSVQTSIISQVSPVGVAEVHFNEHGSIHPPGCTSPQSPEISSVVPNTNPGDPPRCSPVAITEFSLAPPSRRKLTKSAFPTDTKSNVLSIASNTPPIVSGLPFRNVGPPSELLQVGQRSPVFATESVPGAPEPPAMVSSTIGDLMISGELLPNLQQPPQLQSSKDNNFARKLSLVNGHCAIGSDIPLSPEIPPNRGPTVASLHATIPTLPSLPRTRTETHYSSRIQPVETSTVLRIISSPIPSPRPDHRRDNVSSPTTSDDEDDDRDNYGAMISSATSPDASHSFLDQSRAETESVEVVQKMGFAAGMSDPSAQLRSEDERSRKGQTPTGTEAALPGSDQFVDCSELLHTPPRTTNAPEGLPVRVETSGEPSPCSTDQNPFPEISDAPISSVGVTEETSFSHKSHPNYESIRDVECLTSVLRLPSPRDLNTLTASSNQHDRVMASPSFPSSMSPEAPVLKTNLQIPDTKQIPLLLNGEFGSTEPPVVADVERGDSEPVVREPCTVPREYSDATDPSKCVRKVSLPVVVIDLDVQGSVDQTAVHEEQIVSVLDQHGVIGNSISEPAPVSNRFIFTNKPGDGLVGVTNPPLQQSISLPLFGFAGEDRDSSNDMVTLGREPRKNNERARLAKVVFAGEPPHRDIHPHSPTPILLEHNLQHAKFLPDVVNFLLHSAKKRAYPLPSDIALSKQVSRPWVPSVTVERQLPGKDYLTPYFQLEAFEQPLQSLLQSSHKTLMTANHQLCMKEQQTKKVYRRIHELQEKGLWSLRQPVRVREPSRNLCHWDYLLQEAAWLSIDFKQERRFKIAQCKILAGMIMQWHTARPSQRRFLCVDRPEVLLWDKGWRVQRSSANNSGQRNHDRSCNDAGGHMKIGDPGLPAKCGDFHNFQPFLTREGGWGRGQQGSKWNLNNVDDGNIFGYLSTPPVQLFTLGPQETLFGMPLTHAAHEVLSELPLQVPPTLPVDSCILDDQKEETWQAPLTPVSKLCVAKLLLNDGGPPRKRSRYEYEENDELFADDCDSVDIAHMSTSFFPGKPSPPQAQKPVPLPPESTNVALFNPDFKHILHRMQGHHFKPPSFIPPVPFFENRLASQWLPSEDEKLKDLVQRYPQNWALISTFMTFKGDLQSAPERRSPWECFERYLQIEQPSAEYSKSPYYRGIQQRLEASGKASLSNLTAGSLPSGNGGSGSSTPTIRRRGNAPFRVERRKNSKFVHLFESMRKLAKRRELSLTKQQNAVGAANRKADQQTLNKPKLNNFVPAHFSKMKYEREMKIERQARENAAMVAQQRATQSIRSHQVPPYTSSHGIPINIQRHAQPARNGTPSRNSPVVTTAKTNILPQVSPGAPMPQSSPAAVHVLPNGTVPASGGAPGSGIGISLSGVAGLPGQLNGAPTTNTITLGLRQHSGVPGPIHSSGYTQQQIQFLKLKLAQQHQAAQAAAASQQNGSHSVASVAIGSLSTNYSQHAIIAAQQQAINAAASSASMKHQPNGVSSESNGSSTMSPQPRPQLNAPGPGSAGSPRLPQQVPLLTTSVTHQIATWVRSQNPTLNPEQLQKLTEQRLAEYHGQIRQQLTNVQLQGTTSFSTGINAVVTTQQLYQQQQQALRQQHLIIQQQSRQGTQSPAQLPQSSVVGGIVSRGNTSHNPHVLQRSASMQSVGHTLQRPQSLGQQSPRQTQVQQAQMAGIPQVPTS